MYSGGGITLAQLAFERITGTTPYVRPSKRRSLSLWD